MLDALVAEARAGSPTLRQFVARMRQAEARAREAGAALAPTLGADAALGEARGNRLRDEGESTRERAFRAGLALSWEVDLWGRLRATRDAFRREAEATRQDLAEAHLVLATAVATTYLELLEQRQQRRLLDAQAEIGRTLLDLTELRFGQSQASIVDVLQQREQLESTESLVPDVEARLIALESTLGVLLGNPGNVPVDAAREDFPHPAPRRRDEAADYRWLLQRPDLLAAHRRLEAADAAVAAAVADQLPRLALGAGAGVAGSLSPETLVSSLTANAVAPLFEGGALRARVALREAQADELLHAYAERYLVALGEWRTATAAERSQAEKTARLENQLATARRLLRETRNRYSNGLTDYLPVLAAIQTTQRLEREVIEARRDRLLFRVAVHRSLGGR